MTSTSAITLNADNAHVAHLMQSASELLTKNAKKNGIDKIKVMEKDGVVYTYPNLINIKPDFNFRDLNAPKAKAKLMELAHNIAENGVLQPILLFKEGELFYAEDGHRRLAAVNLAITELGVDVKLVPVRLSPKNANDSDRILSLINYNSGEQPTSLEMASIFGRLEKLGWNADEIAKKVGKSRSRVVQLLEMNALPESLKTLIRTSDPEVRATFVQDRFTVNKKDEDKTVRELEFAIETARNRGYDRATAKHLPADAAPGRGTAAAAPKSVEDVEDEALAAGRQNAPAPETGNDVKADAGPSQTGNTPAGSASPERRQLRIVPGAPAGNVPMPDQAAGNTPANNSSPKPADDANEAAGSVDEPSLSMFKKAAYNFFGSLEIHGFERDGVTVPTFDGGSFETEQQWLILRNFLKL